MTDKPINFVDQINTTNACVEGETKAVCYHCKAYPCYELSFQGPHWVKTFLYDEKHLVCAKCYHFMHNTGRWFTKIVRFLLKINIFLRPKKVT